jgi:hypothetical protein
MRIVSARTTFTLSVVASLAATLSAEPQNKSSNSAFEQQLRSQYVLTQGGHSSKAPGTVILIQHEDLNAGPNVATVWYLNVFKDGQRKRGGMREAIYQSGGTLRTVQVGERFYISKIEVKDNALNFFLVACDPSGGKTGVSFQFAKGYQTSLAFPDIQQAIGQVFTIEGQNQNAQPAEVATQPVAQPAPEPAARQAPPAPQAEPTRIGLGQTTEQVLAAMGKPEKIVNLGEKQIYMYKDLKITFMSGKVSDVQ